MEFYLQRKFDFLSFLNQVLTLLKQNQLIMKKVMLTPSGSMFQKLTMFFTTLLISVLAIAQDKKVDVNINTKSGSDSFFTQPWVWVVGGAVFLLLLVALLRNNNSKN